MKITVKASGLLPALKKAKLFAKPSNFPVLGCVLFQASSDALVIAGSNIETRVEIKIPAEVSEPGETCIPADHLLSVVTHCGSESISFTAHEKFVDIAGGKSKVRLFTLPAAEFIAEAERGEIIAAISAPAQRIKGILSAVIPAADSGEIGRPELESVHLASRGGVLFAEATNAHRLHAVCSDIPAPEFSAILPIATASAVVSMIGSSGVSVEASFSARSASFLIGGDLIDSTLIEGRYPDVARAIPPKAKDFISCKADELLSALGAGALLGSCVERSKPAVIIEAGKAGISVTGDDASRGKIRLEIDAPQKTEAKFKIAAQYLCDAIKCAGVDESRIEFTSEIAPIAIREGEFTAVVMVIRSVANSPKS